jgi:transglutaminase-like putative cysteine protease
MQITLDHWTTYRYNSAVTLDPHTIRLQPRMSGTQWLLAFNLEILPKPAGTAECLDQDGNFAHHAWFTAPTNQLSIRTRSTVRLLRENPFDFLLSTEPLILPLWYKEPLSSSLFAYRLTNQIDSTVKDFALKVAAGAKGEALGFLTALTHELHTTCKQLTRPEGPAWRSDETLRRREGACRDLAVLFCDACRVMGIAARFVSGYECASAGRSDSYMHAWAEVYLPNAGWRGYDPSRGLAVSNAHVAVAAGFDFELAAPISGSFTGTGGSNITATIVMNADPNAT